MSKHELPGLWDLLYLSVPLKEGHHIPGLRCPGPVAAPPLLVVTLGICTWNSLPQLFKFDSHPIRSGSLNFVLFCLLVFCFCFLDGLQAEFGAKEQWTQGN